MGKLVVKTVPVGLLETCCYVVYIPGCERCLVIDPGADAKELAVHLDGLGVAPEYLLPTHSHFDHIGALVELKEHYPDAVVACHPLCSERMQSPQANLGYLVGVTVRGPAAGRLLNGGDTLDWEGGRLRCLHVPGHAPGHLAFYAADDGLLFCGDTLLAGDQGRTDFPGCDHAALVRSLREEILQLPPQTTVYPGHGRATTIAAELQSNPFVRALERD